jgi:hypothetical protein
MAERVLYHNDSEPVFPYEHVLPQLSWLPSYVASYQDPAQVSWNGELVAIIDTLLVFCGARTSCLHALQFYSVCEPLVARLNFILGSLSFEKYQLDIVRRGSSAGVRLFFVVRKRNPRFIWNRHLTHKEVGSNLDMFAAGHFERRPSGPGGVSMILEQSMILPVFNEAVLLEYLTLGVKERFIEFNKKKEKLYNDTMELLGLDFRFLWLFESQELHNEVAGHMKMQEPPPREWWLGNYAFVVGYSVYDEVIWDGSAFCGWDSCYEIYWGLIQQAHDFCLKYRREEQWQSHKDENSFWVRSSELLDKIRVVVGRPVSPDVADAVVSNYTARLKQLADLGDNIPARPQKPISSPRSLTFYRVQVEEYGRAIWEAVKLHLFERYKLTPRFASATMDYPEQGDEFLF